jgi:ubiquinone/menaquinone biosynthesis C-methylase UbiE
VPTLEDGMADLAFMSNLLEHLKDKQEVLRALEEAMRILKPAGRLLILQPNIRFAFKEYWDFFDHNVPLSHLSLCEALSMVGFRTELVLARFLPYTTKSRLPKAPFLVKLYLKLPFLWRVFGKQAFIVASKPF